MSESIIIEIDQELQDLVPGFLDRLGNNLEKMRLAVSSGQFEDIRVIGHKMKGSGGGYGFDRISELGSVLEKEAAEENVTQIKEALQEIETYLQQIEIRYIPG